MRRDGGVLLWVALAAAGIVVAVVVALIAVSARGETAQPPAHGRPLRVAASISPRVQHFGDSVTARVRIAADTSQVDPRSLSVDARFDPYSLVAAPVVRTRRSGRLEVVTWIATLRCLEDTCLLPGEKAAGRPTRVTFPRGAVLYAIKSTPRKRSSPFEWPALLVSSRLDRAELEMLDPRDVPPWRADDATLAAPSYRIPPRLFAATLYAASALLVIAALVLLAPLVRRRRGWARADHARALTPLEQAFVLLESDPASTPRPESRREALELVAEELSRRGAFELELSARRLAWSEEPPPYDEGRTLAASARLVTELEVRDGA